MDGREAGECTKEAYEMQFFGFSSRAVSDCGNCNLRKIGTMYYCVIILRLFESRFGFSM
jgi:hypothetical protein